MPSTLPSQRPRRLLARLLQKLHDRLVEHDADYHYPTTDRLPLCANERQQSAPPPPASRQCCNSEGAVDFWGAPIPAPGPRLKALNEEMAKVDHEDIKRERAWFGLRIKAIIADAEEAASLNSGVETP